MRRYYLIDTENTGYRFISGAENLTDKDTVILFHNAGTGPEQVKTLTSLVGQSKAVLEVIDMSVHTKNAMDFEICAYLGVLVGRDPGAQYYIVSNDKGYGAAIDFICRYFPNVTLAEIPSFSGVEEERQNIDNVLSAYPRKVRKVATDALKAAKNKQELNCYLQQHIGKDSCTVYHLIKGMAA
jgi:hypothetical protein